MKGHSSNSRYRLKTKSVHGIRTGEHNNPHVMKAAARADGGICEGMAAPRNLGRMGRMRKREDGGAVPEADRKRKEADAAAGSAAGSGLAAAGSALGTAMARSMPGAMGRVFRGLGHTSTGANAYMAGRGAERYQSLMKEADDIERDGRKCGGKVGKMHGGITPPKKEPPPPPPDPEGPAGALIGAGGALMGRGITRQKKADGGGVAEVGSRELKQHALEHRAMAKKGD
jgi:hypothetical protein